MEIRAGNKILRIEKDDCLESPRTWDNLGTIAYKHRNYELGEEKIEDPIDWLIEKLGFNEDEAHEFVKYYRRGNDLYCDENKVALEADFLNHDDFVALPLYLYDHGSITIATKPFGCRWDSGQLGYIYATKETMEKEYGKLDDETRKTALKVLEDEIKTFDQYVTGEVYGFEIVEEVKCEECGYVEEKHIDSSWGFYGSDPLTNGMLEHIVDEELVAKLKEDNG